MSLCTWIEKGTMAYTDFTIDTVRSNLGVTVHVGPIFPDISPIPVPAWLTESLARGMEMALTSEKARSEFIVAPILLAVREATGGPFSILSGQRLDVDPARSLVGECDFILARAEPLPLLQAPVV